jgi:hypothetical protein
MTHARILSNHSAFSYGASSGPACGCTSLLIHNAVNAALLAGSSLALPPMFFGLYLGWRTN